MQADKLMLRCYAECTGNQWQAICIDPYLTTKADTFRKARSKLKAIIGEYVFDDLTGDDRKYYGLELATNVPFFIFLKYWFYMALSKFLAFHAYSHKLFTVPFHLATHANDKPAFHTEDTRDRYIKT